MKTSEDDAMTDPIREAFERKYRARLYMATEEGGNYSHAETRRQWNIWQAAWKQSRREALEWAISEAERWHAFNTAAAIRAAAEEEGK